MTSKPIDIIHDTLNHCIADIARRYGYDQQQLAGYALQAPYAEFRPGGNRYPEATGTPAERRLLYALCRLLNPSQIVECGVNWGVSTIQLLSAKRPDARMVAVDIRKSIEGGRPVGALIPIQLRHNFEIKTGWDAESYLQQRTEPIDLLFEDTDHTYKTTRAIYEALMPRLSPHALCISHDATNYPDVPRAIQDAGFSPTIYVPDTTPYGLVLCRL